MNNVFVYCEVDEKEIADVSLELLSKGRELALVLKCKLEAIVLGFKIFSIEKELFEYGVDVICVGFGIIPGPVTSEPVVYNINMTVMTF